VAQAEARVEHFDSVGRQWVRTVSHRYLFARHYPWQDSLQRILIHEATDAVCCFESERETVAELTLAAWPQHSGPTNELWRARLFADGAELWNDFYRTVRYGCCDSSDALEFYHVRYGGPVFVATALRRPGGMELPTISVPNGGLRRHVAFVDRFAPVDLGRFNAAGDEVVGVLQYGPPEGPAQRHRVTSGRGADWRLTDIRFVLDDAAEATGDPAATHDLWSADGRSDAAALTGFSVHLVLYDVAGDRVDSMVIPVRRDRLIVAEARLPAGLVLHLPGATP
jgi:hypothetical protein